MIRINDYIKLHRKFLEWEWYTDVNTKTLFLHLLLKANWRAGKWQGRIVERGQLISSQQKLSEQTGLTVNEIRTAIKHLELTNEITSNGTRRNTVFTVVNYDKYQTINEPINEQVTGKSQPINDLLTTIEEEKEVKKERKKKCAKTEIDVLFEKVWKLYPNKAGKNQISDKTKRLLADVGCDKLTLAIERYKADQGILTWRKDMNGSTFFNGRYEDYLADDFKPAKPEKQQSKENSFNNFDQRKYDYAELERQLLNKKIRVQEDNHGQGE